MSRKTSINPIGPYVNPIDLGGYEIQNSPIQLLQSMPQVTDHIGETFEVGGKLYWNDGTSIHNLSDISITNVTKDTTSASFTDFITNTYNASEFEEGDIIVFTLFNEAYVNLGTNLGTTEDFVNLPNDINEAIVKGFFSATAPITYNDGVYSLNVGSHFSTVEGFLTLSANSITTTELADDSVETANIKDANVTEAKLSSGVQSKLNTQGHTWSLATTGVSGVTYSNGVFTITHNMNTRGVAVVMRDSLNDYARVPSVDKAPTVNTVTIAFAEQPTENQYKVTIYPESLIG